ncbi:hypothetical protein [Streptomyces melanogenes]|uniref:hypothetical protein n=1 Tax=Streptomyces melanogenes TaxID=67326 RepID=UPI0037967B72
MHGPDSWLRRASKGLLCASVCLLLGAVSHVAAGGRLPGPSGLGLVFAALTVVGTVLFGGRRRRFDVTTLALGVTQFGLHLAFHHLSMPNGSPSPAMTAMTAMPGRAGKQHAMAGQAPGAHAGMDMAGMAHAGSGHVMTPGMTLAHAVATLGTALCVIHGERILRRLATLVLPRLRFAAPPSLPVPSQRQLPPPPATDHVRLGVLFTRCRPRRGPPPVIPA